MTRKASLSPENLAKLGIDRLALIIIDEASVNAGFKRRINAALASLKGPQAIATLIDRRLSGLERARSHVSWERERALQDDMQALCDSICKELCMADPAMGMARLIRFIATHEHVFERVDDSSGKIQAIYQQAIAGAGETAERLSAHEMADVPDAIMSTMAEQAHGYLLDLSFALIPHVPPSTLEAWDNDLEQRISERDALEAHHRATGHWFHTMTDQWRDMRQKIAVELGALDRLIAIEQEKPIRRQRPIEIARRLHEAGRMDEALDWVRRTDLRLSPPRYMFDDRDLDSDNETVQAVLLEFEILTRMGRKPEATQLAWDRFAKTLEPRLLRAHLKALPDFEDMEAEERAMAFVQAHDDPIASALFFIGWRDLNLAAQCIITRHAEWRGSEWTVLPTIAERVATASPLAASILYRALLDDILKGARHKAYSHGARYLQQLDLLALDADADPERPEGYAAHAEWCETIRAGYGRKARFWAEANALSSGETPFRGRRPGWVS